MVTAEPIVLYFQGNTNTGPSDSSACFLEGGTSSDPPKRKTPKFVFVKNNYGITWTATVLISTLTHGVKLLKVRGEANSTYLY